MTRPRKFGATRFAAVPLWVLDRLDGRTGTTHALAVYAVLRSYAHAETDEAWPSRATIGARLGVSPATVKRAVGLLVDVGAVVRVGQDRADRRGSWSSQRYWLPTDPPEGVVEW